MPEFAREFPFSEGTVKEAESLTHALRECHLKGLTEPKNVVAPGYDFAQTKRARSQFTGPLSAISREVPMADIEADVQDFGVLVAYARMTDGLLTVLDRGKGLVLPVLPHSGLLENYQRVGWPFVDPGSGWFRRKFFQAYFDISILGDAKVEVVQDGFFGGLQSFLTARIGGFRSRRSGGGGGGGGRGTGGGGTGGGSGGRTGGTATAQLWEINTSASGLQLGFVGTHSARPPTGLAGGVTTPVDVYLPFGTLYLAANASAGGSYVVDYGVQLNVPDPHPSPVHTTAFF
jgi:hypothetical protein